MNFSANRRTLLKTGLKAGLATALLPASIYSANAASNRYGIIGQPAPELEIADWIDPQGKSTSFNLADHKGKFIFMEFWQAWCPGCHSHGFPSLKKISDDLADNKHFTAIAIQTTFEGHYTNTFAKVRKIQKQYDLNIIMGHDAGDKKTDSHPKTMINYRSGGTPWAVLISPEGKVIYNDFSINPESAISVIKKETAKLG